MVISGLSMRWFANRRQYGPRSLGEVIFETSASVFFMWSSNDYLRDKPCMHVDWDTLFQTVSIGFLKVAETLHSPNGIKVNNHNPNLVINEIFYQLGPDPPASTHYCVTNPAKCVAIFYVCQVVKLTMVHSNFA